MKLTRERLEGIKKFWNVHRGVESSDIESLIAHAEATLEEPSIKETVESAPKISEEQATIRDDFAMAALTGLTQIGPWVHILAAQNAYQYADAMLAARKEKQ